MHTSCLVSDFDGTITDKDFYLLIAERYMDPDAMRIWEDYRAGKFSHFDAMKKFFSHAPDAESELAGLLRDTEPDPRLSESVQRLADSGWDLVIVSAGSSWYIDRLLHKAGVQASVHANPGRIEAGKGLVLELARESPFFDANVGVDKAAVVRDALSRYERVAFAGDGPPDLLPALLVPDRLRFARGFLAEELQRRGELFVRYNRWSRIVDVLTAAPEKL